MKPTSEKFQIKPRDPVASTIAQHYRNRNPVSGPAPGFHNSPEKMARAFGISADKVREIIKEKGLKPKFITSDKLPTKDPAFQAHERLNEEGTVIDNGPIPSVPIGTSAKQYMDKGKKRRKTIRALMGLIDKKRKKGRVNEETQIGYKLMGPKVIGNKPMGPKVIGNKVVAHFEVGTHGKAKIRVGGRLSPGTAAGYTGGQKTYDVSPGDKEGHKAIYNRHGVTHVHYSTGSGNYTNRRGNVNENVGAIIARIARKAGRAGSAVGRGLNKVVKQVGSTAYRTAKVVGSTAYGMAKKAAPVVGHGLKKVIKRVGATAVDFAGLTPARDLIKRTTGI